MKGVEHIVVRLCAEGIAAEAAGHVEDAHAAYTHAWEQRHDDWDACVAAHYLARHQPSLTLSLHWNQEALRYADALADDRAANFRPSLLLNLGYSYELLGDAGSACHSYQLALAAIEHLPVGAYRDMITQSLTTKLDKLLSQEGSHYGNRNLRYHHP